MDCKFVNGQRVVCISVRNLHKRTDVRNGAVTVPRVGTVYTIRELVLGHTGQICIRLVEIVNRPHVYIGGLKEIAFDVSRFRPVDETRLDVFRSLLTPTKEKING